jgi:Asp-tRNA(Asn)/Glu-tRNA(Gln) amidotransferase A subunit family amidase
MLEPLSPLTLLRLALADQSADPMSLAEEAIARANGNASRNTYIWFNANELRRQAAALGQDASLGPAVEPPPLSAVPISLKDCFDLAGTPTSCGSRFYAEQGQAASDSAVAGRLRTAGALITGKTHLHPLAYGITGENPEYGDCLQPRNPALLTGGSSSGAASSVQEGSALAAIGTDTGGSIRVPAALCGLVGYRASHRLSASGSWWMGGAHLAPSFDTLGLLLRDPRDAAPLAHALLGVEPALPAPHLRIGCVTEAFLYDCVPEVLEAYRGWKQELAHQSAGSAMVLEEFDASAWHGSLDIFAGIQAHEAAELHAGNFDHFEPAIRDRLRWGASLTPDALAELGRRRAGLCDSVDLLLQRYDLLMLPAAPVCQLAAGADHSSARAAILRYTTPFSLAGLPALTLPGELMGGPAGTGVQIAAAGGRDQTLLAFAESIGDRLARRL